MEYPVHVHELNVQDPFILADPVSEKYYLYANKFNCGKNSAVRHGTGNTFYAMESTDLITWSNPILIFEQNDFWASEDYSAPEVHYYKGPNGFSATSAWQRRILPGALKDAMR